MILYLQICRLVSYGSLILIICIFKPMVIILENQVECFEGKSQSNREINQRPKKKKRKYLDLSKTAYEFELFFIFAK